MKASGFASILAFMAIASGAVLAADVVEVLRKADLADRNVSYRGIKTATLPFKGGITTSLFKVVHLKPDKTRTDYFSPIQLAGVVVLQDGPEAWKFVPSDDVWEPIPSCCPRQADCPQQADCMRQVALQNYNIRMIGFENIAGRPTYVLYATPKHPGEPARRIWIDREYYLIMGMQVEARSGLALNSSRYVNIQFNPPDISPAIFKTKGKVKQADKKLSDIEFKIIKPSYLPPGYRLVGISRIKVNNVSCAHLQYSNGVNLISFFQRKIEDNVAPPKLDSRITNMITCTRAGLQYTLMGDVSRSELRKIAESAR